MIPPGGGTSDSTKQHLNNIICENQIVDSILKNPDLSDDKKVELLAHINQSTYHG
jgi:hypothetical protein